MRLIVESLERLYKAGKINDTVLRLRVKKGTITEEEFTYITGKPFQQSRGDSMAFNEVVQTVAGIVAIFGFLFSAFGYVVLKPIYTSLDKFESKFDEMLAELKRSNSERHKLDVRLAQTENSVRSAHHRLDSLEKRIEHQE